jgi:hypothetical protein
MVKSTVGLLKQYGSAHIRYLFSLFVYFIQKSFYLRYLHIDSLGFLKN